MIQRVPRANRVPESRHSHEAEQPAYQMSSSPLMQWGQRANQFLLARSGTLRYQKPYYWEYRGTHYEQVGTIDEFTNREVLTWLRDRNISTDPSHADKVEKNIRSMTAVHPLQAMPARLGEFEPRREIINVANGVLDLSPCRAGEEPQLHRHSHNWFITYCLPYAYDPSATCPRWEAFLEEVLEGDPELIAVLQEWFGYCCVCDTSLEKAMFFEGEGANGKSQTIAVLEYLVGSANTSAVALERFGKQFGITQTRHKLVNLATETDPKVRINVNLVKAFISGDPVTLEYKGVDDFKERPTARLVIAMNERAKITDFSEGIWRRLLLMPFNYTVPVEKRIPDLGRKIAAEEGSGILNWAIAGLRRLMVNKRFTEARAITETLASYRDDRDPIRFLLQKLVRVEPGAQVTTDELWVGLSAMAVAYEKSISEEFSKQTLGKVIPKLFGKDVKNERVYVGNKRVRAWIGLGLTEEGRECLTNLPTERR